MFLAFMLLVACDGADGAGAVDDSAASEWIRGEYPVTCFGESSDPEVEQAFPATAEILFFSADCCGESDGAPDSCRTAEWSLVDYSDVYMSELYVDCECRGEPPTVRVTYLLR